MERKGNNIAEDTFLYWLEVERYMAQFKEGNFENYDECLKVLRHLAVRELQMSIDKCNSQGVSIEILEYVSSELYPKNNASIAEIEEIVRCFKSMMSKYYHMRQDTQLMFSIAINLADNVLDILRAME